MKIQKMGKRLVASFLLFMTAMVIIFGWMIIFKQHAYASTYGNYTYTTNTDGTVTITRYTGPGGTVTIPSTLGGKTVSTLGIDSFPSKGITSVFIPSSVTSIGAYAFNLDNLSSVSIPNSVTSIGAYAFHDNYSLSSVSIPNSVTSIGSAAFLNNSLTSVTIPSSVTTISSLAFAYNKLTSVTIPSNVTSIQYGAFENNRLTNLSIPKSVTSIANGAFAHNSLTQAIIANPSTTISTDPFSNNPSSLTLIGAVPSTTQTFANNNGYSFSNIAKLSGLSLNQGTVALTPTFSSGKTSGYTASVGNSVSSITMTPTVGDTGDTVTVDGKSVASGRTSSAIPLNAGSNTISIVVTSQSGATQTYTVTVNVATSAPAGLTHSHVTQTGWTEGWDPVLGATGYNVYLNLNNPKKVASTTSSVYSYQFTGEKPGNTYSVQVSAVNGAGQESSLSTPDSVTTAVYGGGPVPPDIIQDSFTEPAQVGQKYAATVHEIGGTSPMTWSVVSGTLPSGLSLDNQGIISGTPTTAGKYTFTVKVTDANNLSSTKRLTLTVNGTTSTGGGSSNGGTTTSTPPTTPVSMTTAKEHSATIGHSVNVQLQANGGDTSYAWSAVGTLPRGLSLNATTGVLSGTPVKPGVDQLTVKVTGAQGTNSEQTITVDVLHNYEREVLWNGAVKNLPAIVQKEGTTNTTYMPIWYVMQLLKPMGITSTWDGKHWHMTTSTKPNLSSIQAGSGNTGIYLNGTLVQNVNTVAQHDPSTNKPTTYMPIWYVMQLLKRVGLQSTWNGTTWTVSK